jgi:glycosyltransferase involved in cell wall biosynthesis
MGMRIGFLVPADFSLGNPGNGIVAQARAQAAALQKRGHEIIFLNPWQYQSLDELDVLHFYLGGFGTYGIESLFGKKVKTALVMSPIIDSNQPDWTYRIATHLGLAFNKVFTIPGELARQARASDVVICRSEHERSRVTQGLGVNPSRTAIVLNGGDIPTVSQADIDRVREQHNLPDKFVLNVSAYTQDRKNVLRMVEAVEQLDLPVVLAGHVEKNPVAQKLVEKSQRNPKLKLLGFVDRLTRDSLYHLCHVFGLPSFHEGTGLAALEAGAAAARIVITRNGGPPDYFLDYASYVNPFSVTEIREAIASEWRHPRNNKLATHVRSALTWDASALQLEQAYTKAISSKQVS